MKEVDLRICSHERQLLAISDLGTRTSGRFLNSAGSSRAMLLAGFIFRFEQCRVSIRRNFVGEPGRTLSVLRLTTMLLKRSSMAQKSGYRDRLQLRGGVGEAKIYDLDAGLEFGLGSQSGKLTTDPLLRRLLLSRPYPALPSVALGPRGLRQK
jgi:hypothetical protein